MTVILSLREAPDIPLEADTITPTHFAGKSVKDIEEIPIQQGNEVLKLKDFFDISGESGPTPDETEILIKGDLKKVKMIGLQDIGLEVPGLKPHDRWFSHETLLGNNIPIIENLKNLEKLKRERIFYIGLPLKIMGLDSSWIRAVALEEL